MKIQMTESELNFLTPGIMYNAYCMEAVAPTNMKYLKEIMESSVNECILEAKTDGTKSVRSNRFLDLIYKVRQLPLRYNIESSETNKKFNELKTYISKTPVIDNHMIDMSKKYISSLKKDLRDNETKLRKYRKDHPPDGLGRNRKEDINPAIIKGAIGIISIIAILSAIKVVVEAFLINLKVISTLLVSNLLHYAWGLLMFPIHTILALTWNIIKRISRAKDIETIKDLMKRLLAKYFKTKGVIANVADKFGAHDIANTISPKK